MRYDLLTGTKIRLREMRDGDLKNIYDWENRPELWYLGDVHEPLTKAEISSFIAHSANDILMDGQLRLMIDDLKGRSVGCIDLFDFDRYNERAGIGILIANESDRRKGYANEAVKLLSDYCFKVLNMKQLYCHITVDNLGSQKLFEANGFEQTGRNRDWVKKGKTFLDAVFMQRLNG